MRKSNFKNSKYKLFFIFLIVIMSLGIGVTMVSATTVIPSATPAGIGSGSGGTCGSGKNCYYIEAVGVRISAVRDDNGARWNGASSLDFWYNVPKNNANYTMSKKYIRQEVIKVIQQEYPALIGSSEASTKNLLGYTYHGGGYTSYPRFGEGGTDLMKPSEGTSDVNGAVHIINHIANKANKENDFKPLQQLLDLFGVKHSDGSKIDVTTTEGRNKLATEIDTFKNLVFQFEPLVVVRNHGGSSGHWTFAGTASEYAYFTFKYGYCYAGSCSGGNDIGNVLLTRNKSIEGVFSETSHAGLYRELTQLQLGQSYVWYKSNGNSIPSYFLLWYTTASTGFISIEDILKEVPLDCNSELLELSSKYTGVFTSTEARNDLLALRDKIIEGLKPNEHFDLLTDWEKFEGKTAPECCESCEHELNRILEKHGYNYSRAKNDLNALYTKHLNPAGCGDGKDYNLLVQWQELGESVPQCKYKPPKEEECSAEASTRIDTCTTGYSYFKDDANKESWLVCELAYIDELGKKYSSDNTGHEAVETTNGGIVGNYDYCELFCTETVSTDFPTKVYNVKAGQTFVWGSTNGVFGSVSFTKKCSNQDYIYGKQGYRFEEWKEDYLANEKAMINHYMRKASYEMAAESSFSTSSSKYNTCDYRCSCTCSSGKGRCCCGYKGCPRYRATATSQAKSKNYTHNASGSTSISVGSVTGSVGRVSQSTSGHMTKQDAIDTAKSKLKAELLRLAGVEKDLYDGKKIQEGILLEKIRQCTNNLEYVYGTIVTFVFEEPINAVYGANTRMFEYYGELDVMGSYNQNNVNTSKCKWVNAYSYTCSGSSSSATCNHTLERVRDCTVVTWDIKGEYTHYYPSEDFIWYTLKTDSTLLNEKEKQERPGGTDENFFYYVGFGLPTALSLTNGSYELKVIVTHLGDKATTQAKRDDPTDGIVQYNTEDGHFWPIAKNIPTGEGYGFEYICTYEVENEIFGYDCRYQDGQLIYASPAHCDPTEDDDSDGSLIEIDVAYRVVTLLSENDSIYKAFPGIDGGGRSRGSNWRLTISKVKEILSADVYDTDQAMYEIMLDINAINRIREDNEDYFNFGTDPYTSYYDATNHQKVYCAGDGEVKYCASDYISELHRGDGLNYPLLGTCLPTSSTLPRAEYILENGCDVRYTYPDISWIR